MWHHREFIQLSEVTGNLLQQTGAESLEKSRYLKITAKIGWLEVCHFSASELLSINMSRAATDGSPNPLRVHPGFYVQIPVGEDGGVYPHILEHWDLESDASFESTRVSCVIIPVGHRRGFNVQEDRMIIVIMLRNHGNHYERIGSFEYPQMHRAKRIIFKHSKGVRLRRIGRMKPNCYSDEELARDFNNPEMQTLLLG